MTLTRREFLRRSAIASSGLMLASFIPEFALGADADQGGDFEPNAFIRIAPDETVTLTVIRHEMGQGVCTLLPMMLADELEADWSRIRIEQAVTTPAFKGIRLHTSGSGSSRGTFQMLRTAGATAREMLVGAAAERWSVPVESCRAEAGFVIHAPSGRRLSYGSLAGKAAGRMPPESPRLKEPEEFKFLGKSMKRIDGPDIVTGRTQYGMDVRVPDMVFASIERGPALGAKLVRYDDAKALRMPGVLRTMPVRSGIQQGVAVVATSTWAAMRARGALEITWDAGRHAAFDSDRFEAELDGWLDRATYKVRHEGDAPGALAAAHRRHEATYTYPFQAHAPLEVMNCTADVRADRATFWAPTQTQHRSMEQAIKVTGLEEDAIRIHAIMMGGAFGRRLFADYLAEAGEISKAIARPVQVVWSREDDMRHGYFQPCTAQRLTGGLDADGRLVALQHRATASPLSIYDIHAGRDLYGEEPLPAPPENDFIEGQSPWGAFDNPYEIPNLRVDAASVPSPVPHGPWRAVEYPTTVWGRESFLDELAHIAGVDPLEFRVRLLGGGVREVGPFKINQDRLAHVLRLAAEKSGWGNALPDDGRLHGRGIAANVYHAGSYIAQVAEVSVARDLSDIRVHRIVSAVDCGFMMHPEGLMGQTESGITWGLSATLGGKVEFRNGLAVPRGYADFTVTRMNEMPRTEMHFVPSHERPGGYGEHPVPMVAPAVANAIYAATKRRVRQLPITPERLQAAQQG
jgi:isoquinoline 1-oxidoreductase beta subunit